MQVPQALAPRNGDLVRLAPGRAEIIDEVPAGRLFLDGGMLTPENGEALRERRHAATNGVIHISLVLDRKGKIASGPQVRAVGMPGDEDYPLDEALDDLAEVAVEAMNKLNADAKGEDDQVETAISRAIKKASQRIWERRPIVETTVLRV